MTSTENVEKKVASVGEFVARLNAFDDGGILVAFSGGPDSTALLSALVESLHGSPGRIGVAYYNHRLRGERQAKAELHHVVDIASGLHLEVMCGEALPGEIRSFAADYKLSTEEAARVLRYRFLRSTARSNGYRFIATGHTSDDLIETLIQRFFQGSGVWGLCGIPRIAGMLIRPILDWSREDVDAYNASRSIVAFADPSNSQTVFLRNHIRHAVVPAVLTAFPEFKNSLNTLAVKMAMVRDYLDEAISSRAQWEKRLDSYVLSLTGFVSLHPVERIESVRRLLDQVHQDDPGTLRIRFGSFSKILSLPALHDNSVLFRGWGYRLQVHGNEVFLEPDVVFGSGKGYFKVVNSCEELERGSCLPAVAVRIRKTAGCGEMTLALESLSLPLIIRSRREGDAIRTGDMKRDLKKLFNEWHVPEHSRWMIPVCEDKTGIIAVFGGLFGFKNLKRQHGTARGKPASVVFERC